MNQEFNSEYISPESNKNSNDNLNLIEMLSSVQRLNRSQELSGKVELSEDFKPMYISEFHPEGIVSRE